MWWRLKRSEFDRQKGEKNRESMKAIVKSGEVPGIIIYLEGKPAGWCSLGPRENFPVLERSRIFKKIDDQPVWSIVCFVVPAGGRSANESNIQCRPCCILAIQRARSPSRATTDA